MGTVCLAFVLTLLLCKTWATLPPNQEAAMNVKAHLDHVDVDEGKTLQVKRAAFTAASDGNNTVLAAVTGKKIRVIGLVVSADVAGVFIFQSGAGGTELMRFRSAANGMLTAFPSSGYLFETAASALLNIVNPAGSDSMGMIQYVEV